MACRDYDREDDPHEDVGWLCQCGNWEDSWLHCMACGAEPPWGCPCSGCQDSDGEDVDLDDYLDPGDFIA